MLTISFIFTGVLLIYGALDLVLSTDHIAATYPTFADSDDTARRYAKHVGYLALLTLRVFITTALLMCSCIVVVWVLKTAVIDLARGGGSQPMSTKQVTVMMTEYALGEEGRSLYVRLAAAQVLLGIGSLIFMNPSNMQATVDVKPRIKLYITLLLFVVVLFTGSEAFRLMD